LSPKPDCRRAPGENSRALLTAIRATKPTAGSGPELGSKLRPDDCYLEGNDFLKNIFGRRAISPRIMHQEVKQLRVDTLNS